MYFGNGSRAEFGQPPPEDLIPKEHDLHPRDEFSIPVESYSASELAAPGPEYVMPGEYEWTAAEKKDRKPIVKMAMYYVAAALLIVMSLGLLKGPSVPARQIDKPTPSPSPEPSAPTVTAPVVEPEPQEEVYVAPKCDLVAFSFSSEIRGRAVFTDMENAEKVTYEVWDPLTESLELSEDITEQALTGVYEIGPFYTDFIYDNHTAEYEAANSFPMEIEIRIIIDHPEGPDAYSAIAKHEIGWYAMYEDATGWDFPSSFIVKMIDSVDEYEIVFDEPDKVTGPGIMSISCEIDGKKVPADQFRILIDQFEATWDDGHVGTVTYRDVILTRPPEFSDGEGHVAHFSITQYLEQWDRVFTTEQDIEF